MAQRQSWASTWHTLAAHRRDSGAVKIVNQISITCFTVVATYASEMRFELAAALQTALGHFVVDPNRGLIVICIEQLDLFERIEPTHLFSRVICKDYE